MEMNHIRRGTGKPLLLIHGLGGSWRTWMNILDALAAEREVIAIDLPGHGETPPLPGEVSMDTLAEAVTTWLAEQDLTGVDVVGNFMGARLVLELARRVVVGWGTKDRLTLPRQAERALERFPNARLYWFEGSGHYSHWDAPAEAVHLILASTG